MKETLLFYFIFINYIFPHNVILTTIDTTLKTMSGTNYVD